MKIGEYEQMMSYLTRPTTQTRENFAEAGYVKPATEAQKAEALKRFKKPFNELDPQTRSRIRTGSYSDQEIGSWKKLPITKTQEKVAQKIYGQPFEELSKDRKTKIRTGRTTLESGKNPIDLMPTQERVQYTKDRAINFVKNFKKENGRKPSLTEMRKIGKFDYQTIKNFTKEGIINIQKLGESRGLKNPQTKIIDNDLRLLNNNQYIKDSFKKGEVPDFNKVAKILKTNDKGIVDYRITQLASTYLGDRKVEGIKPSYKKGSELILDTATDIYTPAMRRLADLKIGKSVGERSTATTRGAIRYNTPEGFGKTYAIDEPGGTISSVRRGSTPYGAFGQIIKGDLNKQTKYEFDRKKSINEKSLQNAIATGDKKKINETVKKFNNNVSEYERKLNKDVKPGQPKIKLFKVSLKNPKETITNYSKLSKDYQNAFQKNYEARGYSFKVPSDIKPLSQIAEEVKNPKVMSSILKKAEAGASRLYSNPMADPTLLKQGLKDMGKFGKYAGQIALSTPAGAVLATKGLGGTFDPRKTEGRLTAGAEAAFAPGLVKGTEALTKNKILQTILNLGLSPKMAMRAARVASPLGIATLAGEGIYQGGKYMLERKKLLESLTDEQRDDLLSRERSEAIQQNRRGDPEAFSGIMAANGGLISRQGFADGPKDPKMNRRTFMKVMGGLASIPILGKFMKPAAKVVESAAPVVTEAAKGVPPYFFNLVAKIKKFGEDVSQKYATQDREVVTKFKDYELTEDLATGEQTIQRMKVLDDDSASYYGNPLTEETYMNYKPSQKILLDESNPTGGVKKTMPEYEEGTAYLRSDREFAGDIVDESAKISDDVIQEGTKFEDDFMDFEPKKNK